MMPSGVDDRLVNGRSHHPPRLKLAAPVSHCHPSLLMASRDLTRVLEDRYSSEQAAQAYVDYKRASGSTFATMTSLNKSLSSELGRCADRSNQISSFDGALIESK